MDNSLGYVKIPRTVFSLPIWEDPWDTTLWFYCALRVAYKPYGSVLPGQFISAKAKIAEDLHWSRNGLKAHLKRLQDNGCIDVVTDGDGVCITLKHWDCMSNAIASNQSSRIYTCDRRWSIGEAQSGHMETTSGHTQTMTGHSMTTDGHAVTTSGHPVTAQWSPDDHIQEEKKEKTNSLSKKQAEREREFITFWDAYPRHEGEADAREAFLAKDVPFDRLMAALEHAKQSRQWMSSEGRFIPVATKWLDGTWRDCVPKEATVQQESGAETADDIIRRERAQWKRV